MQDFNGQICGPCEVAISGHLGFGTITWQYNQYGRKLCLELCEYLKMNVQRCMSWNWTIHCWRSWVIPDMQEWAAKYDMCNTRIGRVGSRRRRSHGRAVSPRRTQNTASLSRVFVEGSSRGGWFGAAQSNVGRALAWWSPAVPNERYTCRTSYRYVPSFSLCGR